MDVARVYSAVWISTNIVWALFSQLHEKRPAVLGGEPCSQLRNNFLLRNVDACYGARITDTDARRSIAVEHDDIRFLLNEQGRVLQQEEIAEEVFRREHVDRVIRAALGRENICLDRGHHRDTPEALFFFDAFRVVA